MFPCLAIFIVFIAILTYYIRKSTAEQAAVEAAFWEKERKANSTLKADISTLDYISIPVERFPPIVNTDSEKRFLSLADKKILNFTGVSNTDLKLEYGFANLETLSEYESNYNTLVTTIPVYAKELIEANYLDSAIELLEFGVSIDADVSSIYTELADAYKQVGKNDKIPALVDKVNSMNMLTKDSLVKKLEVIYHT